MKTRRTKPLCVVIAGPNGAGKTTFAREFLPKDAGVVHFVNTGHGVAKTDVLRRFARGWANFQSIYRPIADGWSLWDNSGVRPSLLEVGP